MKEIILINNFCIDCGHLHYTPYWFEKADRNLIVWRSYLCDGCADLRLAKLEKKSVYCAYCKYHSNDINKVIEHSKNCSTEEGDSHD